MPIYADEVPFDDLRKLEKYHVCAECGAFLRLSWSNERNCYMLRCQIHEHHNGIRRLGRDPEIMEIRNKLKGEPLPMETTALIKLNQTQMLARVDKGKFTHELTKVERDLVTQVCIEYGLDPLFGELQIYQGKPFVNIDARRRKAQETNNLDGINGRPATKEEKKAHRVSEEDYLYIVEVWVKCASHPFEGWGKVSQKEIEDARAQARAHNRKEDALPIVKDPGAMAEKRAEAQGLRRAFHLPLPSFEEIIEAEFINLTPGDEVTKSKSSLPKPAVKPPAPTPNNRLTEPQRKKIWGDASKMGYSEDDIHAIIEHKWGVESINDLTIPQASALIDTIQRGEGVPVPEPKKTEEESDLEDIPF